MVKFLVFFILCVKIVVLILMYKTEINPKTKSHLLLKTPFMYIHIYIFDTCELCIFMITKVMNRTQKL